MHLMIYASLLGVLPFWLMRSNVLVFFFLFLPTTVDETRETDIPMGRLVPCRCVAACDVLSSETKFSFPWPLGKPAGRRRRRNR